MMKASKKTIYYFFIAILLYLFIRDAIIFSGNTIRIKDHFVLAEQNYSWLLNHGIRITLFIPLILLLVLLSGSIISYIKEINYSKLTHLIYGSSLVLCLLLCCVLNIAIVHIQKPYLFALNCINNKITLDELAVLPELEPNCVIYISRENCDSCLTVKNALYNTIKKNEIKVWHYDTLNDRETNVHELQETLDKYGVNEVPALLFFMDGSKVYHASGSTMTENLDELFIQYKSLLKANKS